MIDVKVKNISFNTMVLKECKSLKDAYDRFSIHSKEVVKEAYYLAKKVK